MNKHASAALPRSLSPRHTRTGAEPFFFWLAWAYLLLVVLGFGKSFFLRPLFDNRAISPDVYLHGIVLTAWFMLFALQATLVRSGHRALHRILGRYSVVLAIAIVVSSAPVAYLFPSRLLTNAPEGFDIAGEIPRLAIVVVGNTGFLILFSLFYTTAIVWRQRTAAHKRLMSLAAYCIVGPAVGRLTTLWGPAGETSTSPVTVAVGLAIPAALVAYDLVRNGRVHCVNAIGIPLIMVWLGASFLYGECCAAPFILWLAEAL